MSTWSPSDLQRIGSAEELAVASRRRDGTLSPYVTIWVVRAGDDIYIRSAHGPDNTWFRNAEASAVTDRRCVRELRSGRCGRMSIGVCKPVSGRPDVSRLLAELPAARVDAERRRCWRPAILGLWASGGLA